MSSLQLVPAPPVESTLLRNVTPLERPLGLCDTNPDTFDDLKDIDAFTRLHPV